MGTVTIVGAMVYENDGGMPGKMIIDTLFGVFSTRAKAMDVWNDKLETYGITNVKAYSPMKNWLVPGVTNRYLYLNSLGHSCEKQDDADFIVEMYIKDVEIDHVLEPGE